MTSNFNKKPQFPFTYGDEVANDGERLSDYVVKKLSDKKTQRYLGSVATAVLVLGTQVGEAKAIPAEYGEAANNIINQAGEAACQGGPPIGQIQGNIPDVPGAGVPGGPSYYIPRMPIEDQRRLAAQQARHVNGDIKPPATPPVFWSPKQPKSDFQKLRSTAIFIVSAAGVCSQAGWNPIAAVMCGAGLALSSLAISRPAFFMIVRLITGR